MSITNLIGNDCLNIIKDYKNEMDVYEKQYDLLDGFIKSNSGEMDTLELNIAYIDFKDYFIRKGINYNLKFQIEIYGNNSKMNSKMWDLDLEKDNDTLLKDFNISEIIISESCNTIYLRFDTDNKDMDIDTDEDIDEDMEIVWDEEMDFDDDDSDLELWNSLQ